MKTLFYNNKRTLTAVLIIAGCLTAGFGLGSSIRSSSNQVPVDVALADELTSDNPGQTIADFSEQGSHVFAMYWRGDDELWYVVTRSDGQLSLVRYNVGSGTTKEFTLPERGSQSPHTYLVEDGSGLVWVGMGYVLAAFSPRDERFVFSAKLSRTDALAAETSPAGLPGTWINGIVRDSDGRLTMTRNNVRALFDISQEGARFRSSTSISPSGLRVIDGVPIPFVHSNGLALSAELGPARTLPSVAAGERGCQMDLSPNEGTLQAFGAHRESVVPELKILPQDLLSRNHEGDHIGIGLKAEAKVGRFDCTASKLEFFRLPGRAEIPDGAGAEVESVVAHPEPDAVAISPDGSLAYSTSWGQVAVMR